MSNSISATLAIPPLTAAAAPAQPFPARAQTLSPTTPPASSPASEDHVELSTSAQISALKQQGASAGFIASSLGLSPSEVKSDLGIETVSDPITLVKVIAALIHSAN